MCRAEIRELNSKRYYAERARLVHYTTRKVVHVHSHAFVQRAEFPTAHTGKRTPVCVPWFFIFSYTNDSIARLPVHKTNTLAVIIYAVRMTTRPWIGHPVPALCERRPLSVACGMRPPCLCQSSPASTDTSTEHAAGASARRGPQQRRATSSVASRCAWGSQILQSSGNPQAAQTGARYCRRRRWGTIREYIRSEWPQRSVATNAPNPLGRDKTPARRQSAASD